MGEIPIIQPSSATIQVVSSGASTLNATASTIHASRLADATIFTGVITGNDASGHMILKTPQGEMFLRSADFLRLGNKVKLRISRQGDQVQARILTVDGKPLPEENRASQPRSEASSVVKTSGDTAASRTAPAPIAYDTSGRLGAAGDINRTELLQTSSANRASPSELQLSNQTLSKGETLLLRPQSPIQNAPDVLRAYVSSSSNAALPNSSAATVSGGGLPDILPSTAAVKVQVISVSAPSLASEIALAAGQTSFSLDDIELAASPARGTANPTVLPAATPASQQAAPALTASTSAPASAKGVEILTGVPATVNTPAAENAPNNPAPAIPVKFSPLPASGVVSGMVMEGSDIGGEEVMIRTPFGAMKTISPSALEKGTVLQLQLISILPSADEGGGVSISARADQLEKAAPASLKQLSTHWETLENIPSLLAQDAAGAALIPRLMEGMPQPNANMTTSTLFFLMALKGGDIRKWIGEDVSQWLEQHGRSELLGRLSAEFGTIRQVYTETAQRADTPWQAAFLPVFDGEQWQQARLFTRRESGGSSAEGENSRFVIEMSLTHLGDMQLDGLFQRSGETRRFDLMVRTVKPLEKNVQEDINRLFTNALSAGNHIFGEVKCVTMDVFPIMPMEEVIRSGPPSMEGFTV